MPTIFHITHVRNVPGLIEHGGLLCDRQCNGRGLNRTGIGYAHIKERRMNHVVPLPPGGTLGDYVPFYFAPRSPMLFTIHKGNTPDYDGGQTPIIHLVSSVEAVVAWRPELQWLFTDGHADMELSDYYNDLSSLDQVDWPVMRCRYWGGDQTGERRRRRQAEFLVYGFLPWELVSEIGVINSSMAARAQELISAATHKPNVNVKRDWYY